MDDLELPDDLDDVEVIYSDGEDNFDDPNDEIEEEMNEDSNINEVPITDQAKLTFTQHTKSVFCGDLSKDSQLAVTGGEDDSAYVWSTTTGEVVLECTGHRDSVTEALFNHDSRLVATGDIAGMIQVWDVAEKKLIWCYEGDDLEWMEWHPLANVLLAGGQAGDVYIWQVPQGTCKVLPSHGATSTCSRLVPDGKRLLVGYGDGQLKLWDIKTTSVIWQLNEPQKDGLTSIDINSDNLISTAPTSALLKLNDGKVIIDSLLINGETEIEVHSFNNELGVLVTGSLTGQLCVWDLGRRSVRHQAKIECAVTILKAALNGRMFVGATDGVIYLCDIRTGSLLDTLTGHKADVLSLCVSNDGSIVLSTSDDGTAKIFHVKL